MGEEMIIVADDIRLTREMYAAWKSMCQDQGIAAVSHGDTASRDSLHEAWHYTGKIPDQVLTKNNRIITYL